jgi:hypothetical protein
MSPQLLSEYFGGRNNTVHAHHGASSGDADNHSTPPEASIEHRLRGYGMSGFRPAGLPDAWSWSPWCRGRLTHARP